MKTLAVLIIALIIGAAAATVLALSFYQPGLLQRDIVSGLGTKDSLPVIFENATNLTNNPQDSVYGQVAAWNSSVHVIWQDSVPSGGRNYDIFIKKSTDEGITFGTPINLSNNNGFSEHPQLSAYGGNVYAVWADNTPGNREVLFVRSTDNENTFEKAKNLSNNTSDSHNQEVAAFGANVYVVWLDKDKQEDPSILFTASADGGETFGKAVHISKANLESFPKVAAYGDDVYITWNVIGKGTNDGLYFAKSSDRGGTFDDVTKLDANSSGESQVSAYNSTVYVISGGLHSKEVNSLFFIKSADRGETFAEPIEIDADGKFKNPLNVEVVASDNQDVAYVAGQVFVSGNEEILLLPISGNNNATAVINLSKNAKISECPSIAMAGDNIYVVWEDLTPGNHEILYAKGTRIV